MVPSQTGHLPRVPADPDAVHSACGATISRFSLHLKQYPSIIFSVYFSFWLANKFAHTFTKSAFAD